jgi:hypothetical protein
MGIASIEEKINKCPFSGSVVDFIDHSYSIGSSSGYYYLDYHFNSHTYQTSCRDISRKLHSTTILLLILMLRIPLANQPFHILLTHLQSMVWLQVC